MVSPSPGRAPRASTRSFQPSDTAIMVPHTDDGRVLFVIPWHERVLVGTTDTPIAEAELEPRAARRGDRVHPAQRRPLPRPGSDARATSSASSPACARWCSASDGARPRRSRASTRCSSPTSGLVTIVGGKWTTYRKMARGHGRRRDRGRRAAAAARASPRSCVLHGWMRRDDPDLPAEPPARVRLATPTPCEALARDEPGLAGAAAPALPYRGGQVVWAARHEMARTVEDVLARRTRACCSTRAPRSRRRPRGGAAGARARPRRRLGRRAGGGLSPARRRLPHRSGLRSGYFSASRSLRARASSARFSLSIFG